MWSDKFKLAFGLAMTLIATALGVGLYLTLR